MLRLGLGRESASPRLATVATPRAIIGWLRRSSSDEVRQ